MILSSRCGIHEKYLIDYVWWLRNLTFTAWSVLLSFWHSKKEKKRFLSINRNREIVDKYFFLQLSQIDQRGHKFSEFCYFDDVSWYFKWLQNSIFRFLKNYKISLYFYAKFYDCSTSGSVFNQGLCVNILK